VLLESAVDNSEKTRLLIIANQNEHGAIRYLLNDSNDKQIDLTTPKDAAATELRVDRYDEVYLDGAIDGGVRRELDSYISTKIQNDKQSKPVAYRVFDLSAKVGSRVEY
jgi:hypothetical protein